MVLPVVAILAAASLVLVLALYIQKLNRAVDHTDTVIDRVNALEKLVIDRAAGLRGYLLTGDRTFLDSLNAAGAQLSETLGGLDELVSDDAAQVSRLGSVREQAARWGRVASRQLALKRDGANGDDAVRLQREGKAITDDLRASFHELIETEERLRAHRARRADDVTRYTFWAGTALTMLLGAVVSFATATQMRRLRQKYNETLAEHQAAQLSLRESEERFRTLADNITQLAWMTDEKGRITWFNRRWYEYTGEPIGEPDGTEARRFVHPDHFRRVVTKLQHSFETAAAWEDTFPLLGKDGHYRWFLSRAVAIRDEVGKVLRWFGTNTDVTAQREAEQALREADQRKNEFLSVLSHELRNPLAPIRNSMYVLDHSDGASEQAQRAKTVIARQVEHLTRLVDDLLEVRRISAGKMRLHQERIDLVQAVRETAEDIRPLFVKRSLALDLLLPREPLWVSADATRLAQVIANLLHNASKFTDAGGHVSVAVETRDGQACIRVRDDGVGVAPEIMEKLFDPFVQGEQTLHRSRGGLGLGLALVRGIVELHGGTVVVHSEGIGKGTEFAITLPQLETRAEAVFVHRTAARPIIKRRVLVIEDNQDAAESLRDVLEVDGGHEVHVAPDGISGIEAAHRVRPDVILCDLGLPGLDGYEVARRLRGRSEGDGARLVALSGYSSPDDVERALLAGFDYHVGKPPDLDQLLGLVRDAPPCGSPALQLPPDVTTGYREVDSQHAAILAELGRMRSIDPGAVWGCLDFLNGYTASHFSYEQALMDDVSYPNRASHQQEHEDFLAQFLALKSQLERDGATEENVGALVDAVEAWVTEHVLRQDQRLADFIRTRQVAAA